MADQRATRFTEGERKLLATAFWLLAVYAAVCLAILDVTYVRFLMSQP